MMLKSTLLKCFVYVHNALLSTNSSLGYKLSGEQRCGQ